MDRLIANYPKYGLGCCDIVIKTSYIKTYKTCFLKIRCKIKPKKAPYNFGKL